MKMITFSTAHLLPSRLPRRRQMLSGYSPRYMEVLLVLPWLLPSCLPGRTHKLPMLPWLLPKCWHMLPILPNLLPSCLRSSCWNLPP